MCFPALVAVAWLGSRGRPSKSPRKVHMTRIRAPNARNKERPGKFWTLLLSLNVWMCLGADRRPYLHLEDQLGTSSGVAARNTAAFQCWQPRTEILKGHKTYHRPLNTNSMYSNHEKRGILPTQRELRSLWDALRWQISAFERRNDTLTERHRPRRQSRAFTTQNSTTKTWMVG